MAKRQLELDQKPLQRSVRRKFSDAASDMSNRSTINSVVVTTSSVNNMTENESNTTLLPSDSDLSESSTEPSEDSFGSDEDTASEEDHPSEGTELWLEESADTESKIINLRPGMKPVIGFPNPEGPNNGGRLLSRLQSFLPQMQAANEVLEKERSAGTLQHRDLENISDEDDQIIEMVRGAAWAKPRSHFTC